MRIPVISAEQAAVFGPVEQGCFSLPSEVPVQFVSTANELAEVRLDAVVGFDSEWKP